MRVFAEKHNEIQQPKSSIPNRTNALKSHDVNPKSSSPVTGNSWDFSRIPVIAPGAFESEMRGLDGHGSSLPKSQQAFFESMFGHDFTAVRIHSDSRSAELAKTVNARAFTLGQDIVFGKGEYRPESRDGARLLAHELAHVVQQRASHPRIQRQPAPTQATNDPHAKGGTYDQLEVLRRAGTLDLSEYKDIEHPKGGYDVWSHEVMIRRYQRCSDALEKLGELKDQRAVPVLIDIFDGKVFGPKDFDPEHMAALKEETLTTLAKIGGPAALAKLHDLLTSKDPNDRMIATRGYSAASGKVAVADLLVALKQETDVTLKSQIIMALVKVSGLDAKTKQVIVTELISVMENNIGDLKRTAITALGTIKLKTATEPLIKELKAHHGIALLAGEIVWALGEIGDDSAVDILVIMLEKHGSPSVRGAAARALGQIGGEKAHAALQRRLKQEPDTGIQTIIAKALAPHVLHWEFKSDQSPSVGLPQE